MNSGWNHKIKFTQFPLRLYLKQLFFASLNEVILSPKNFWYTYQIEFLEKYWLQDIQQQLKGCLYNSQSFYLLEQHWSLYWMQRLERSWERECIDFLEKCWLQE